MRDDSGGTAAAGDAFALHCRGDVRLYRGGADCTPKSKKGRALLAILAAEQRPLSRVKIIDLLWSDRQEEQARASLRTLLADLKAQIGDGFDDLLAVDRERIELGTSVRTDLTDPTLARPAGELFEGLDHIDPELDEWLRIERTKWRYELGETTAIRWRTDRERQKPLLSTLLVVVLTVAAVVIAVILATRPWVSTEQPVVAVLKFKDLTGRNGLLADGLAEELRIHLAQHARVQVIGRESSESAELQIDNAVEAARVKLSASHVIEGTVLEREGGTAISARLVSTASNQTIWSDLLRPQGSSLLRSASQIAGQVASNVDESIGQRSRSAFEADAAAYALLFKARQLNGKWDSQAAQEATAILAEVVDRYPNFAPALAAMAEATMRSSDHPSFAGPMPLSAARAKAEAYARRAIRAAPGYGQAYSAMGLAHFGTGRELPFHRRAAQLSPGSFEAHRLLAKALELHGDMEGSLQHNRRAVALDPLSLRMVTGLERALGLTGRRSEISALVSDFSRRSDNRQDVLKFVQIASFDTGDISAGYLAGSEALEQDPRDWVAANNLMSMEVWFRRPQRAIAIANRAGMADPSWNRMIISRDIAALEKKATATGPEFWSLSWAREDVAELLVANGRGAALVALYDTTRRQTGGREPDARLIPGALVSALQQEGRQTDAAALLKQVTPSWMELARGLNPGRQALYRSYLAAYAGNRGEALRQLEAALADHWTSLALSLVPLEETSAFRPYRGDPRFEAIIRRYYANIDRELRELESEQARIGRERGDSRTSGWRGGETAPQLAMNRPLPNHS